VSSVEFSGQYCTECLGHKDEQDVVLAFKELSRGCEEVCWTFAIQEYLFFWYLRQYLTRKTGDTHVG
jgi:hypothetical protein